MMNWTPVTDDMIERGARAACDRDSERFAAHVAGRDVWAVEGPSGEVTRDGYRELARTVLIAALLGQS